MAIKEIIFIPTIEEKERIKDAATNAMNALKHLSNEEKMFALQVMEAHFTRETGIFFVREEVKDG